MSRDFRESSLSEMDRMKQDIRTLQKLVSEARPTIQVRKNTQAVIPPFPTTVRVAWQEVIYDTDGMRDSDADFRINTTGQYRIWCSLNYSGDTPFVWIRKNLTVDIGPPFVGQRNASVEAELDAGDKISMSMQNVSSGSNTGDLLVGSLFGMSFIGPKLA